MSSKKLLAEDIKEALSKPFESYDEAEVVLHKVLALAELVLKEESK